MDRDTVEHETKGSRSKKRWHGGGIEKGEWEYQSGNIWVRGGEESRGSQKK